MELDVKMPGTEQALGPVRCPALHACADAPSWPPGAPSFVGHAFSNNLCAAGIRVRSLHWLTVWLEILAPAQTG